MSHRNQSIVLFCKSVDWFLYDMDLRHEIFKTLFIHIQREPVFTCCKAWFAFFVFVFFLSGSSLTNVHDSQDSRWRGMLSSYILSTTSTCLTDTWTLAGLLLHRAASHLNFCSLALSVCLVSWYVYSIGKSLFPGRLRIALDFYSHYRSFLCQNLY